MKRYVKRGFYIAIITILLIIAYPPLSYKKLHNDNPLPENIVKGVFHVHSDFSDGKGDLDEITKAAIVHGLDFIVLTDHGRPNIKCATSTSYYGDVLLIGGSEFSTDCGHLASAGFPVKKYQVPSEPQESINYVKKYNGFSFISHPFDKKIPWKNWEIEGYTGIEILSSYSSARRISILRLLAFPFRYILNHEYSLLGSIDYPEDNIKIWDSLNQDGKYMGIYALDAHAQIPLTKKISLHFPSYESIFSTLNIYVMLDSPFTDNAEISSARIIKSIRKGRFYNVIEAIAPANGFKADFITPNGTKHLTGETIPEARGTIRVELPFRFPVRLRVVRNGKQFHSKRYPEMSTTEVEITKPGVYRCEIFTEEGSFTGLPWIMTNPFYAGIRETQVPHNKKYSIKKRIFSNNKPFKIENNDFSSGELSYLLSEDGIETINMKFDLKGRPEDRNYWVSMAARGKLDLTGFKGIMFEARSSEEMAYWLEIRSGGIKDEYGYRHSFITGTEWEAIYILFDKFHLISKNKIKKDLDLSSITSVFFSINNAVLNISELSGRLEIRDLVVIK